MKSASSSKIGPRDSSRPAILLVQLGTPDRPTSWAVYRYLTRFLSDRRVVSLPQPFWRPLLYGLVAPLRAPFVAAKYRAIWLEQGSPLRVYLERLAARLRARGFEVAVAMRYGSPSLQDGLDALEGAREITILPLYPQFSQTTTLSVFDEVVALLKRRPTLPNLRFISSYYDSPHYIRAVADQIGRFWQEGGRPEKLLFSFHSLPERSRKVGDPYFEQCHGTARKIAEALPLREGEWEVVFQSQFGFGKWLEPACFDRLERLAVEGISSIDVVCPGFAIDCLETLEEIAKLGKSRFLRAGGVRFRYIPALNDDPLQVALIERLVLGRK